MSYDYTPRKPTTEFARERMLRHMRYLEKKLTTLPAEAVAVREHWMAKVRMIAEASKLYEGEVS